MTSPLLGGMNWRKKVVLAYIEEPPFGWTTDSSLAVGSDIELANVILGLLGVETIEYRLTTFAALLPGVENGLWDINVPLFVTPERAAHVNFSLPVWALGDGFLVSAGNPKRLLGYAALACHDNARLGVITGQVQHHAARLAGIPEERIVQFGDQADAINALRRGKVDAYASTALGNRTLVERIGREFVAAITHQPQHAESPSTPKGAFSFSKNSQEFLDAFNHQLRLYLGSADHRRKMQRFGLTESEIDPVVCG